MSDSASNSTNDEAKVPTLRIKPNGAIRVNGTIDFVDENGAVVDTKSDFSICTCGRSKEAPICDGSHKLPKD